MHRSTFTLEEDNYRFLLSAGGKNRSAFINQLLAEEKRRRLAAAILQANQEEAEDEDYQVLLDEWDTTLMDGLRP